MVVVVAAEVPVVEEWMAAVLASAAPLNQRCDLFGF